MIDLDALSVANGIESELEYVRIMLVLAARQAEAALTDPEAFTPNALYNAVLKADGHYAAVVDQVEELIGYTRRMLEQRESAKEAFTQGWEARLKDLIDKLDNVEYADLLQALDEIRRGKR